VAFSIKEQPVVAIDQILSVCTGIGGLDIGFHEALRHFGSEPRTVCMVEREAFCVSVLGKAIEKGRMDGCPIWCGDLRDLPIQELPAIDWITGGYPCQPFSSAGKQLGEADPRHLWPIILDIIRTVRPRGVFFENVAGHLTLGLDRVLQDLERCGFRSAFGLFTAEEVGASHRRERVFILSLADTNGYSKPNCSKHAEAPRMRGVLADTYGDGLQRRDCDIQRSHEWPSRPSSPQRSHEPPRTIEPRLDRDTNGLPDRVDRLRSLGNSVVSQQAKKAAIMLMEELLNA
jgi:DNA (cytosine-5)-methyltransferase 1